MWKCSEVGIIRMKHGTKMENGFVDWRMEPNCLPGRQNVINSQ